MSSSALQGSAPASVSGVGVGLRHRHFQEILENTPDIPWLEVHSENFFKPGAAASLYLEDIRKNYPLSAHSVGLSLGSAEPLDETHLNSIKDFIARYDPVLVSDHLSWSTVDGIHISDLLPLPYTEEALDAVVRNISHAQDVLGRQILIENPSSYLTFAESTIPEWEFFVEAATRSGCGILLDINNIYVSAMNHGFDMDIYLNAIPIEPVQEMHLAGFAIREIEGEEILIDDHGARVYDPVWKLYEKALQRFGEIPTLIEWDTDVPELSVLLEEAEKARGLIKETLKKAA